MPGTLSPIVDRTLNDFVAALQRTFGDDLSSVLLFGTAAEGQLRATSDVNVMVVLTAFDPERAQRLAEPLGVVAAAVRLRPMFVLETELPAAADAFAR
jgi:predicted nucleotidyltransferase